jgi:hypothetical protein
MLDLDRQEIKNAVGIFTDPNPSDLPPNAWNEGRNVRFKDGKAIKSQGHEAVFGALPGGRGPKYAMPYLSEATPYWFVTGGDKIFRTEGTAYIDVSRAAPYSTIPSAKWNGGFLSGVAILNNGVDVPQFVTTFGGSQFADLTNWPVGLQAKVVRPFKNYLIALNLTKTSVQMPTVVKWSSPADPGNVPFTWDETDPTNDAGENPLADTAGAIVDGKKLRDQFIIYKEDSVYTMRYIGGVFVFQFQQLFDDVGMISQNCAAEFDGKHFVVGQGDVYVHNGVQKNSVIEGKVKKALFDAIRAGSNNSVFVVPDYANSEMWVCFQSTAEAVSGSYCDRAAIYNWTTGLWTFRDLPQIVYATFGVIDPRTPDTWASDPNPWDSDTTVWGNSTYNPAKNKILLVSESNKATYSVGDTSLFGTSSFKSTLMRTDLYGGDDLHFKNVNSITPHIKGSGICNIYVGASQIMDAPVRWQGPFPYKIGTDFKIDCRVQGRYIGVRFEFDSVGQWEFSGYTIETNKLGGKR